MPRSHAPYPAAFRQQIVDLVRSGRSPEALAKEFDPTAQAIRNWVNSIQLYLVTVTLCTLDLGAFSSKKRLLYISSTVFLSRGIRSVFD